MGMPAHQIDPHIRRQCVFLSSNYALYGDMSHRVTAHIGDLMGDNQMMLPIDSRLHVIAHHPRSSPHHGANIWSRHRNLLIRRLGSLNVDGLQLFNFFCEGGDLNSDSLPVASPR